MYGFFLLLLLSLYYLFSFFVRFELYGFLLFRAVYSRRSPHTAAAVTDDVSAAYTYNIDPARRRSRRFALLFAKKLFRNKFTRAMTLAYGGVHVRVHFARK